MKFIDYELHGSDHNIVVLRLNRPEFANAYNNQMLLALEQHLNTVSADNTIQALIVTGAGHRAFCAGADKSDFVGRRVYDGLNLKSKLVFDLLANLSIPTIAAINGAAIGGGLELALACDIRIASQKAKFAFPEIQLDLTPAAGGMTRLPQLIGLGRAKELILFGRELDSATALAWGLVSQLSDDVVGDALLKAQWIASRDPLALRLAKEILNIDSSSERHRLANMAQGLLYEQKFQKQNE